jgi:predicted AAA+ superfamily ATPase
MENMIFIELLRRGYSVDVGVVEVTIVKDGKRQQSQYEIDFIVNTGREKVYIQSALNVDTEVKKDQETFSLKNSGDFFRKIVILDGNAKAWTDEEGIMYIGVIPFLLEENPLNF